MADSSGARVKGQAGLTPPESVCGGCGCGCGRRAGSDPGPPELGDGAAIKVMQESVVTVPTNSEPTIPRFLYRYRALHDGYDSLRKILQENRWYFGSRVNFDDQEDCILSGVKIDREYLEHVARTRDGTLSARQLNRIQQLVGDPEAGTRIVAEMQGYVDNVGILCLSELDDDTELWRKYADYGSGVCLQLDMTKLIESEHYLLRGPFEVMYRDGPKSAWDPLADEASQQGQTEDCLFRKSSKWACQKEWRFIMHRVAERTVGEHSMPLDALSAVILGKQLTESECRTVSHWIRSGPWNPAPMLHCRNTEQSEYWL